MRSKLEPMVLLGFRIFFAVGGLAWSPVEPRARALPPPHPHRNLGWLLLFSFTGFGQGGSGLRNSRDGAQGGLASGILSLVGAFGPTAQAPCMAALVRMPGPLSVCQCPALSRMIKHMVIERRMHTSSYLGLYSKTYTHIITMIVTLMLLHV